MSAAERFEPGTNCRAWRYKIRFHCVNHHRRKWFRFPLLKEPHTAIGKMVSFEYEWHDATGRWYRSYGNELREFDEAGLMRRRLASVNDAEIDEANRRIQ